MGHIRLPAGQRSGQSVYESIDRPIEEAVRAEAYGVYQATSQTPALKRFKWADEQGAQFDMDNRRVWPDILVKIREIEESAPDNFPIDAASPQLRGCLTGDKRRRLIC